MLLEKMANKKNTQRGSLEIEPNIDGKLAHERNGIRVLQKKSWITAFKERGLLHKDI